MKKAALLMTLLFSSLTLAQSAVPANFWGIQFNQMSSSYPVAGGPTFQTFRFWDTGTSWYQMQSAAGTYNFQKFEDWMTNVVVPNNLDVIYTIGKTPKFISSFQGDACNNKPANFPGSCVPPLDLQCNGSGVANTGGSDATLIGFVQALWGDITLHNWDQGRQWYFEVWNEPTDENEKQAGQAGFWDNYWISNTYCVSTGGQADASGPRRIIARMASDTRAAIAQIDPTATVQFLSPPPPGTRLAGPTSWWQNYLSGDGGQWGKTGGAKCSGYGNGNVDPCGGGQFADVISVHEYLSAPNETPDDICCDSSGSDGQGTAVYNTLQVMANYQQNTKPLFITEGSSGGYCNQTNCGNSFDPVSFMARYYTLMASQAEVARFAWYNYDTFGSFWCPHTEFLNGTCTPDSALTASGIALGQMQSVWGYDGGTFGLGGCAKVVQSLSCASGGNFRVCGLTEGGTLTQAEVVWFDAYNKSCMYTPPGTGWIDYRDLTGMVTHYSGGPVTVGNRPILFEK